MSMALIKRIHAHGFRAQMHNNLIKIEGQKPMSKDKAEQFIAAIKTNTPKPTMWIELGPGNRPMVFWGDNNEKQIRKLLKAITDDANWQIKTDRIKITK